MSPINPPAPPPTVKQRATLTIYRHRRAIKVGLFGLAYVVGVGLADISLVGIAALAYAVGAAVHAIVSQAKP